MSLFSMEPTAPLAEQLRPKKLDDVIGQDHLTGPDGVLTLISKGSQLASFILWGPPGTGKTTIARLMAKSSGYDFCSLSAVIAGAKDIRDMATRAQQLLDSRGTKTLLFIDEVHRLNKAQQDVLLPFVESGLLTFIGATTENVSFELNAALLSRAQVYVLKPLTAKAFDYLYQKAVPFMGGVTLDQQSVAFLASNADGDARRFINSLEMCQLAGAQANKQVLTLEDTTSYIGTAVRRFDNFGEVHYDSISALHKSVRGSSPDAALYWLARMLDGGVDPLYIARRLIVIASEDVGNADPLALGVATDAAAAYERLGSPEGDLHLAHAVVYLASAPKSNAVYNAWNAAKAFVKGSQSLEVPLHLRNAPTPLMKELGYHQGYRYAHNEPYAYASGESYFPAGMAKPIWYKPTRYGAEASIAERLRFWKGLDDEALTNAGS